MTQSDILLLGVLFGTHVGLMLVEILGAKAFGFLIAIVCLVAPAVSGAISNIPGVPMYINWAGWGLAWLQILFGIIVVLFGKRVLSGGGR